MISLRKVALRPYALLPRQYDERKVLASTVDAWGRALWLICPEAELVSNPHGRARPEPPKYPFDALLVINDAGSVEERTIRSVALLPTRVDALPNGRLILYGYRGARNAQIFGRDGRPRIGFDMGAAVDLMMADRRNNLWSGYFDEGIFSDPISAPGLVRWDSGGNGLWDYRPPEGAPHIADIEALNVVDGAAWAVYWPRSPLLHAHANGRIRVRGTPVGSPRGLAVQGDRALFLGGGASRCRDRLSHCRMTDDEVVVVEEAVATMPNGSPLPNYRRPVGRGPNLYLHGKTTKQWYVLSV
ncbi:hypothetical protein [Streptomyces sp. NPDC051211]|uniref:hypothetical protein n=1 Tax=Streptomyces sp. NPDC051211 TaxID=3154643 RepID=UPI003450949C